MQHGYSSDEVLAAPLLKETRAKYEQALAQKDRDLSTREQALRGQQAELERDRAAVDAHVAERLEAECKRITEHEAAKARRLAAREIEAKTAEIAELNSVIAERDGKLATAQKAQAEILRKERELEDARREFDLTVQSRVQAELGNARQQAKQQAEKSAQLRVVEKENEIVSIRRQLEERDEKLIAAQKAQAEALRKERELDEARRELELTIENKVQAELGNIRARAKHEAEAEAKLPLIEKEQQIASMQKQIEELKRKAEQGSQQLQGEVQELAARNDPAPKVRS